MSPVSTIASGGGGARPAPSRLARWSSARTCRTRSRRRRVRIAHDEPRRAGRRGTGRGAAWARATASRVAGGAVDGATCARRSGTRQWGDDVVVGDGVVPAIRGAGRRRTTSAATGSPSSTASAQRRSRRPTRRCCAGLRARRSPRWPPTPRHRRPTRARGGRVRGRCCRSACRVVERRTARVRLDVVDQLAPAASGGATAARRLRATVRPGAGSRCGAGRTVAHQWIAATAPSVRSGSAKLNPASVSAAGATRNDRAGRPTMPPRPRGPRTRGLQEGRSVHRLAQGIGELGVGDGVGHREVDRAETRRPRAGTHPAHPVGAGDQRHVLAAGAERGAAAELPGREHQAEHAAVLVEHQRGAHEAGARTGVDRRVAAASHCWETSARNPVAGIAGLGEQLGAAVDAVPGHAGARQKTGVGDGDGLGQRRGRGEPRRPDLALALGGAGPLRDGRAGRLRRRRHGRSATWSTGRLGVPREASPAASPDRTSRVTSWPRHAGARSGRCRGSPMPLRSRRAWLRTPALPRTSRPAGAA